MQSPHTLSGPSDPGSLIHVISKHLLGRQPSALTQKSGNHGIRVTELAAHPAPLPRRKLA